MSFNHFQNVTNKSSENICLKMLYYEITGSSVSYWDACLIISPSLFALFLLLHAKRFYYQLNSSSTPIITTFLILVCVINTAVMLRAIISMILDDNLYTNDIADRVLWLIMRFLLLANEMSVLVFGLAAAHLDRRASIRRVLLVTSFIALSYSLIQFALELLLPDKTFHVKSRNYSLYGHGGVLFLAISSFIFQLVYFVIIILPCVPSIRNRVRLPDKPSFYIYCASLSCLYLVQGVGSLLLFFHIQHALCVLNFTVFVYFSFFNPFVYFTFISSYFSGRFVPSYYHLDPDFYARDSRGLINSGDIVRGLDSDLIINENHLQNSTHFTRNPGDLLVGNTTYHPSDLTESCQMSVDPHGDFFSGQSYGKVSSRKVSGDDHTAGGACNLQVQLPSASQHYLPALSPAPGKFNPSLLSSTKENRNTTDSSIN